MGFSDKTGFTFKLMHGEKMLETVNDIELNRYVVQVIVFYCTNFSTLFDWIVQSTYSCFCLHFY